MLTSPLTSVEVKNQYKKKKAHFGIWPFHLKVGEMVLVVMYSRRFKKPVSGCKRGQVGAGRVITGKVGNP